MAKTKKTPTRIVDSFLKELNLVNHSPRFQIILTQGIFELLTNTLIENNCKSGKEIIKRNRDYPYSVKLVLLHEKGLITDFLFQQLNALRSIRNHASHEAQFELTPKMLAPFKGQFTIGTNHPLDDPKYFPFLCGNTVFSFWNFGVKLFAPIFEPHLFKNDNTQKAD